MLDAGLLQGELQADVAHHRGDHGVAPEFALALHVQRAHQHDRVAVHDLAAVIDQQAPVAVAVERDAEAVAARADRADQAVEVGRAAPQVDVPAVGIGVHHGGVEPQLAEQPRHDRGRGAVGAVDGDLRPPQRREVGQRGARVR